MAMKISNQERIDLDMYTKWLAKQAIEIIVESRLGSTISTPSNPQATGTAWFNLNVNNVSAIGEAAKIALTGEVLAPRLPLCVEISLRTPEKDHMVLECWCLDLLPLQSELTTRIAPNIVYNRMGILLKSLVTVTRVTPAYKLSRRQGADSYVILYQIYMGEPQLHTLGEGFKKNIVGQISTPIGTLQLSVLYRTKMTISPTQPGRDSRMMLKSDHFNTNLSPKSRCNQNDEKTNLSDTMRLGAFADYEKNRNFEPSFTVPEPPFSKLFAERISPDKHSEKKPEDNESLSSTLNGESKTETAEEEKNGNPSPPPRENRLDTLTMVSTNDDFIMVDLVGARRLLSKMEREIMFADAFEIINRPPTPDRSRQVETIPRVLFSADEVGTRRLLSKSEREIMFADAFEIINRPPTSGSFGQVETIPRVPSSVDEKTPFASTSEKSELGRFFREWQSAPQLQTFADLPSSLENLDLDRQLETFELDSDQYDSLVQSLCQSSSNDE